MNQIEPGFTLRKRRENATWKLVHSTHAQSHGHPEAQSAFGKAEVGLALGKRDFEIHSTWPSL